MTMLISQDAIDLIVAEEVSSQKTYEARYRHPEWPGGASGITIGIGYDVGAGVRSAEQLRADWYGQLPSAMVEALVPCIGVTGEAARALLSSVRNRVDVPWAAAMAVFEGVDVPRWYDICKRALPNFEDLSLDCKGALVSLAYNRGASFTHAGDRYAEMRAIRQAMVDKRFDRIPDQFRSMKRLWSSQSQRGLVLRREHEAKLFERGLTQLGERRSPPAPTPQPSPPPKAGTEHATATTIAVATAAGAGHAAQAGYGAGRIAVIVFVGLVIGVALFVGVRWLKRSFGRQ